jgi:hypothetical protein
MSIWTQVNLDGFGDSNNLGGYHGNSMAILEDRLFYGTRNWANGGEVWKYSPYPYRIYLPLVNR